MCWSMRSNLSALILNKSGERPPNPQLPVPLAPFPDPFSFLSAPLWIISTISLSSLSAKSVRERMISTPFRIRLASPETIRKWSSGEVRKPETINYRMFRPERDGLFCARIFGPIRDYECLCGKYRRYKHHGVVCEKCGVEVGPARFRRERMGHIELASPVSHIWFLKSLPSRIGLLLDMPLQTLESVLYFEAYIVVDEGGTDLVRGTTLSEDDYREKLEQHGEGAFDARMGAEAIRDLLKSINLEQLKNQLREEYKSVRSEARQKRIAKRLKVIEGLIGSQSRPEWMILEVLPVLPPDPAPAGLARQQPLRLLRPQRPLPTHHQPQQPAAEIDRSAFTRDYPAQ